MSQNNKRIRVAFAIGGFPVVSETFIINQVADLIDRGIEVEIFSFTEGVRENISQRFYDYKMGDRTHYLNMPENVFLRCFLAIPKIFKLLFYQPSVLSRALNFKKYGHNALSLKLIFWTAPFLGKSFDLYHCHFGPIANKFLIIKEILGLKEKMATSFYGFDVSHIFKEKPANYYDRLKKECSLFFVMSRNMRERIVAYGFDANKIEVLPVSIEVDKYPFEERSLQGGEEIKIISVGRFVEKKGFDDLLRALAIVKERATRKFKCTIVGDGPLKEKIYEMADKLKLGDIIDFKGYMKIEDVVNLFLKMHFFVQPSKTAKDGDME